MKSFSFLSRSLAFAALACGLAATFATQHVVQPSRQIAVAVCSFFKELVLDGFKLAVAASDDKSAVVVAFVQAKAFVLRLAKRERPLVTNNWRMCPST